MLWNTTKIALHTVFLELEIHTYIHTSICNKCYFCQQFAHILLFSSTFFCNFTFYYYHSTTATAYTLSHSFYYYFFFFLCTFEIAVTCLFIHAKCYPARWLLKIKNMYLSQRRGTKCRLKNAPEFIDDCVCKYFGFFSSFVLDRSGEIPLEFAMSTKLLMERLKFNLIFVFYFLECLVFVFIQYYLENLWKVVTFGFSKFFTDIIFLLINWSLLWIVELKTFLRHLKSL